MREITTLFIHCSATPPDWDIGAKEIKHLHTAPKTEPIKWGSYDLHGKGWSDIGYHEVHTRDGEVEQGRPHRRAGAHARGHNADSLALCWVGGVDAKGKPEDNRTPYQQVTLARRVREILEQYPSIKFVKGHNEVANKACPSFDVPEWLKEEGIILGAE